MRTYSLTDMLHDLPALFVKVFVVVFYAAMAVSICTPARAGQPLFAPQQRGLFAKQTAVTPPSGQSRAAVMDDSAATQSSDDIDRDTPPKVIGAWLDPEVNRVIIANYDEARRIAEAQKKPLVVMCRMDHPDRDEVSETAPPDAVLTVVDEDPRFPVAGVYRYVPKTEEARGKPVRTVLVQVEAPRQLLFFTAAWCASCKKVQSDAVKAGARIVDVDKEPALGKQYGVAKGIPLLVVLEGGKEFQRAVGADAVRAALNPGKN